LGKVSKKSCQLLGGEHISLNPFTHIPVSDDSKSFETREEMLATLRPVIQVMAAPTNGTTDLQNSFIDQAIRAVWEQYKAKASISFVQQWLLDHQEQAARDVGQMIFTFTSQGSYGRFFEGPATAHLDKDLVVIETDHLRNHPSLLAVVVQMMILQINQSMALGDRQTPFLIIIDEAWKLLQGKDSAAFISEASRTARKYKGSIVLGTQHLSDYFKEESPAATEAFNCSAWKCILYQEADVIEGLSYHPQLKTFVGNDYQKRLLKSVHSKPPHYSEVAIFGPGVNGVIGRLRLDPFSRLLFSTNPQEWRQIQQSMDGGMSITQAIEKIIEAKL
jgi:conjugal transfer ATP-binding protein TraC